MNSWPKNLAMILIWIEIPNLIHTGNGSQCFQENRGKLTGVILRTLEIGAWGGLTSQFKTFPLPRRRKRKERDKAPE